MTTVDSQPPLRTRITGALAAIACAVCCATPLLITAGVLTGTAAAVFQQALAAAGAGLAVLALAMWWLHRRRSGRTAAVRR